MRIYLAGPLGFSEAGRAFHERVVKQGIEALGHVAVDPWALIDPAEIAIVVSLPYGQERRDRWRELNATIGRTNTEAIDSCDIVFAVLDGADVDSGTAAEIGYAFARGKVILGYRGDFRLSADNEGSTVNLQVEYFIDRSGGFIISSIAALGDGLATVATFRQRLEPPSPSP
jgi:nucleoside 2-deoxyribosyltransferase